MKNVKITAMRRTCYPDLMELYENPIEHPCDVEIGMVWVSENGEKPAGFCNAAWEGLAPFVKTLAEGGGNFGVGHSFHIAHYYDLPLIGIKPHYSLTHLLYPLGTQVRFLGIRIDRGVSELSLDLLALIVFYGQRVGLPT